MDHFGDQSQDQQRLIYVRNGGGLRCFMLEIMLILDNFASVTVGI
jgi:hypothetical protein